jgi:hypothetical protein
VGNQEKREDLMMNDPTHSLRISSWWSVFTALTLGVSLVHVLIDYSIGLYGRSSSFMSPLQATTIVMIALIYACWLVAMAWAGNGEKTAGVCLLVLTIGWTFLGNGVSVLVACPPPCRDAFPYQDIAHVSNVLFGALATFTIWRTMKAWTGRIAWSFPLGLIGVLVVAWIVSAVQTLHI